MTQVIDWPISPGSQQSDRFSAPLQAGYFDVDELSFEALLVMARELAGQLHFYNASNKKEGNWQDLFNGCEVVIMAMIHNINREKHEEKARHLLTLSDGLTDPVSYLFSHFVDIDFWYRQLKSQQSEASDQLDLKLSSVIKKSLAIALARLKPLLSRFEKSLSTDCVANLKAQFVFFDPIWQSEPEMTDEPEVQTREQLKELLYSTFATVMSSIAYLQSDIQRYLDEAQSNPTHDPASGLFMAFLKLFAKAQSKINTFTLRHRDFYYRDLLYFSPLPAKPDTAFLLLSGQKGLKDPIRLESGSPFISGKDAQLKDIVYGADHPITVTDAKVKHLYCLNLQRDNQVSPENYLHYVTRMTSEQKSFGPNADPVQQRSVSVFGARQPGRGESLEQVPMGLAIAAPILRLKQGKRNIEVIITLDEPFALHSTKIQAANDREKIIGPFAELLKNNAQLFEPSLDSKVMVTGAQLLAKRMHQAEKLFDCLTEQQRNSIYSAPPGLLFSQLYKVFLLGLMELALTETLVETIYGHLFSRHTLSLNDWLTDEDIAAIREKFCLFYYLDETDEAVKKAKLDHDFRYLGQDKSRIFYTLYSNTFAIKVSTAQGWQTVNDCSVKPLDISQSVTNQQFGFKFEVTLGADFEALVPCVPDIHGEQWSTDDPVIKFSIKPQATFYPYSIFRGLVIKTVNLNVDVKGIGEVVAYNHQGRLDPSKPFNPLGSQPNTHSYLVFGNHEMAHKPLTDLTINFDWAQLPDGDSGFEEYYLGYDEPYANDSFQVDISVLNSGLWSTVVPPDRQSHYPLFRSQPHSGRLLNTQSLSASISGLFNVQKLAVGQNDFSYNLQTRNGWFKVSLSAPHAGFGHVSYGGLLSKILMHNAKNKKQLALPNLPYIPLLNSLTLDYKASSTIDLTAEKLQLQGARQRIIHIHPFGFEQIFPANVADIVPRSNYLFPRYPDDGNMFIGLSASAIGGQLTLFFHLNHRAKLVRHGLDDIKWAYLAQNKWHPMSDIQVIEDTTYGLLTSGIVTLDLPAQMTSDNTILPSGLYWLKVTANEDVVQYGGCYSVTTHAIEATRMQRDETIANAKLSIEEQDKMGTARKSANWKAQVTVAGLDSIEQKTASFGGRIAENDDQLTIRASERLRHKGRAVTAWDYERLIMQAFDNIDKVKCFQHMVYGQLGHRPGHILIIVRRKVHHCNHNVCDYFKVPSDQLVEISAFVRSLCSPFINVDVRDPDYETVQMRCSVKLKAGQQTGLMLSRLNKAFSDHICPWHPNTDNQGFGWSLQSKDLKGFISRLDYVDFVTNFSLLHLSDQHTDEEEYYSLGDSVSIDSPTAVIKPLRPWSILIPASHHFIEVATNAQTIEAEITGINEMEVGFNFIVQPPQQSKTEGDEAQVLNKVVIDGQA